MLHSPNNGISSILRTGCAALKTNRRDGATESPFTVNPATGVDAGVPGSTTTFNPANTIGLDRPYISLFLSIPRPNVNKFANFASFWRLETFIIYSISGMDNPDTNTEVKAEAIVGQQPHPSDQSSDTERQDAVSPQSPYTVFTKGQKRFISLVASFAAMFSTLMSYIYYPALVPMSRSLGVSVTLINLTVTSYLIVAAIAPAFMGDMADQAGRRPIYILMFTLLIAANIGMALQNSYAALFVLRMLQSAGSSGLTSVAYGVIADITVAGERGGFVGSMLVA